MSENLITICAVGDIFLGEHPVTLNHGVNSMVNKRGCDYLFAKIKDHLNGADIVCGNLEGVISPKKENEIGIESAIYWGQPDCARSLRSAGVNCLFLANNHNAQHGREALERTCRLLNETGIKWTGFNLKDPSSPATATFEMGGVKLAFLSYCETQQYNLDIPILPLAKLENIERDVARLKKDCDMIAVSLHWGDEFIDYPSPVQVRKAHDIIDLGVKVIFGHHSHVAQGIENYGGGLIAYSLGSFIKDLWPRRCRESFLLKLEVSKNEVKEYELIPIFINKDYQPEIYEGTEGSSFLQKIEKLSKTIKYCNESDFETQEMKYRRDVKRLLMIDRIETLMHYCSNILRYDRYLLWKNISLMIRRRILGRNI